MTKEERTDKQYIFDILDAANNIVGFLRRISREKFESDYQLQLAVVKLFEIIGEASSRISTQTINSHPEVSWRLMRDMRNKMIHDYFEIDLAIVWDTAKNDIPELKKQIEKLLNDL